MGLALELAAKGTGTTSPNPMVGALVVSNGKVVGRGHHRRPGGPHAEIEALESAGALAKGADLYVTLEPCNHTGKTPPCTEAIINAGISRVVSAMTDPNPHVAGGGHRRLSDAGIIVVTGVCKDDARRLNEAFATHVQTGKPLVLLKIAATLDGRIATRTGDARWVSGEQSRQFVHRLRHRVDAIMVGVGTVIADNPSLTTRIDGEAGIDPVRIVLDTHLSIPENARLLHLDSPARTLVVTGGSVDPERRRRILATGASVISTDTADRGIHLPRLLERLGDDNITSLLIEGGSRVAASALSANIVDRLYLFLAPKFLGGDDGVPLFGGPGPALMKDCHPIEGMTFRRIGEDILLEGTFSRVSRSC
jgi:diaminohydroxyphosphoribosylaminopyrimidine deaminase/5-amino-6-(5-phosphoribosylamino)uracil reductase